MKILGVKIEDMSLSDILGSSFKDGPSNTARTVLLRHLVTINPELIVEAQRNLEFLECLNQASLRTVDGFGLVLAGLLYGRRLKRLTGVRLFEELSQEASKRGLRVFLLGGKDDVAERTAEVLRRRYPSLTVQFSPGSPNVQSETEEEKARIVQKINDFKPDLLFVAFGSPQGELWIYRNRKRLDVGLAVGVGGAFDYLSGQVAFAPTWMRLFGLEWLFRLLKQPRTRLPRIFKALVVFPSMVMREKAKR